MLLHVQGKPLIISNWKWASDSLNVKPHTFCGLMEIKEIITEYKNWSIGTTSVIKIATKRPKKNQPKTSLKPIGIQTRDLLIKHQSLNHFATTISAIYCT